MSSPQDSYKWHFHYPSGSLGPLNHADAVLKAQQDPSGRCWREGFPYWFPIEEVTELTGRTTELTQRLARRARRYGTIKLLGGSATIIIFVTWFYSLSGVSKGITEHLLEKRSVAALLLAILALTLTGLVETITGWRFLALNLYWRLYWQSMPVWKRRVCGFGIAILVIALTFLGVAACASIINAT